MQAYMKLVKDSKWLPSPLPRVYDFPCPVLLTGYMTLILSSEASLRSNQKVVATPIIVGHYGKRTALAL